MSKDKICCKCGKKATKSSPAYLCDKCWYDWWSEPEDEKPKWDRLFEECKDIHLPSA